MSSKKQNTVRINAGEWRSRQLKFPDVTGLRPTPERVRQTIFNWLGQDLTSKICLDLFAGTGVMGFEALSRGAKNVVLVEFAKPAFNALQENKKLLKAEQANIVYQDATQFLMQTQGKKFDVVFCDPPYNQAWLPKILPLLTPLLHAQSVVYVETEYALEKALDTLPNFAQDWQILKQKKAGNVFYHLLAPLHLAH
jgi:16S rRNA (guanine966-N2)-methyltransferase